MVEKHSEDDLLLKHSTFTSYGAYLFNIKDALEFLQDLSKEGIPVLGMEGFLADGQYIIPQLEWIGDWSECFNGDYDALRCSIDASLRLVNEASINNSELLFEIII